MNKILKTIFLISILNSSTAFSSRLITMPWHFEGWNSDIPALDNFSEEDQNYLERIQNFSDQDLENHFLGLIELAHALNKSINRILGGLSLKEQEITDIEINQFRTIDLDTTSRENLIPLILKIYFQIKVKRSVEDDAKNLPFYGL